MSHHRAVEKLDLRLRCLFTMMVSGPSNCGKTTFTKNVLLKRRLKYEKTPGKVFWFYKVYQPAYDTMLDLGIVDEFVEGLVTMEWIRDCLASLVNGSSRHLKLKRGEQKLAQTAWLPYKKQLKRLSSEDNHGQVLARIKKQTGEGVMFTALLSAAIPLITNLIELIVGGKKKKRERKRPAAATAPAAAAAQQAAAAAAE